MNTLFNQIDDLLSRREIKKAEVQIAKQLRSDPSPKLRAELLLRRARARLIGQHPDDTLEDIQTARALAPDLAELPRVLELLADTYFARFELSAIGFTERNDADQALALYQRILDTTPDYENAGWILYQKGRVLLSAGETDAANNCLQEALLRSSTVSSLTALCYERLAFIHLFDYRNITAALSFLDKAAVTYPTTEPEAWLGQLYLLRSRALRERQDHDNALAAAVQALNIMEQLGQDMRGGQQDSHLAIGEILAQMPGREGDAAAHLQQFLQLGKKPLGIDVTWSRVNELLGDMLFQQDRYDAAVEAYQNALSFNPYHPWQSTIYYQMARAQYRLRAYEKAIATIQELEFALTEEGQTLSDYRALHLKGNAYFALEEFSEAVVAYRQAVTLAPAQAEDIDKIETYLRFAEELAGENRFTNDK